MIIDQLLATPVSAETRTVEGRLPVIEWSGPPSEATEPFPPATGTAADYKHALDSQDAAATARFGQQLQDVAADTHLPAAARANALDALFLRTANRKGQVEYHAEDRDPTDRRRWLAALFRDPTLLEFNVDGYGGRPLADLVSRAPEQLIPMVAPLVRASATRQNAAVALAQSLRHASARSRRIAIKALLPWIVDPEWARESTQGNERVLVIDAAGRIGGRSVVRALRKALRREPESPWLLAALARLHDPEAIAALLAGKGAVDESTRRMVWDAVLAAGAPPTAERAQDVIAYAEWTRVNDDTLRRIWMSVLPPRVSLGRALALTHSDDRELAAAIGATTRLPSVIAMIADWDNDEARRIALDACARGRGTAEMVAAIARHLEQYRPIAAAMREDQGLPAFIATKTISESDRADRDTANLLLAFARLAQIDVPSASVTSSAADRDVVVAYLAAVDSREHRVTLRSMTADVVSGLPLLQRRGPEPAVTTGTAACNPLEDEEAKAIAAAKNGPAPEVLILLSASGYPCMFGGMRAIVPVDAALRDLLERTHFDEMQSSFTQHDQGVSEIVFVERAGVRRVVMGAGVANDDFDAIVHALAQR